MPATRNPGDVADREPPEVLAMIIKPLLCCHPTPWWINLETYTEVKLSKLKKIDPQLYEVALEAHTFIIKQTPSVLRRLAELQVKLRVEALRVQLETTEKRLTKLTTKKAGKQP